MLRWKTETQMMADLPTERTSPPFSYVGVDIFGPWTVTARRTSGGCTNSELIPVSTDPSFPFILTPATLLTQKVCVPSIPPGDFKDSDLYKRQWKQVQHLANAFWYRWKNQYLSRLQEMAIRET